MRSRSLRVSCWFFVLAMPALAQVGTNGVFGGVGTVTLGPYDTNILTGGNAELGIQYYPGSGNFWVSRRGTGTSTVVPHSLLEIDQNGALVSTVPQGPGASGGAWGHRDGATDWYAGGTNLFFGDELGIHCYDMTSGVPVYITGAHPVMATNGPQLVTFPFNAANISVGGTSRALAYNPGGDGGNGSFWVANFGSSLVEIGLNGTVLNTFVVGTNLPPQWSAYGLAFNLQTGMLWVNSAPAGSATVLPSIAEIDPATGIFTGRQFAVAGNLTTGPWIHAAQGGLCYIEGRVGPNHQPANSPPFSELGALAQGTPDYLVCHRLDLAPGYDSALEARLEASVNGAAFTTADQTFTATDTLSFQYVQSPMAAPSPAICLANVGVGLPLGDTLNVAEYYCLSNFSNPVAAGVGALAVTLGDGFALGGLLAPDVPIVTGGTQPTLPSIPLAVGTLGGPGTELTLQAVFISDVGSLVATNRLKLTAQ